MNGSAWAVRAPANDDVDNGDDDGGNPCAEIMDRANELRESLGNSPHNFSYNQLPA